MGKVNATFIAAETSIMHEMVTEIYEALMDSEKKESIRLLNLLAEKTRDIKKDLLTKED